MDDSKKEKESPELKEELTDDELKGAGSGRDVIERSVHGWIDERIHFLDPSV